jgi:hypothetical protein
MRNIAMFLGAMPVMIGLMGICFIGLIVELISLAMGSARWSY